MQGPLILVWLMAPDSFWLGIVLPDVDALLVEEPIVLDEPDELVVKDVPVVI